MCHAAAERTLHMISKCSYAVTVWNIMANWSNVQITRLGNINRVMAWWEQMTNDGQDHTLELYQILLYTAWHIWKERCRRVFDNKTMAPTDLATIIQGDILAQRVASSSFSEYSRVIVTVFLVFLCFSSF
ncbi:hypothetical protein HU200_016656 [Digitaria exilis]|uniref:Uncharacterized protein n=1 Tax=Digitaria exilis TaxID=1010633 RepID=A0A835KI21_9POAL|nr:hypothetical protein HU200_016656 [Digitaria exilis]